MSKAQNKRSKSKYNGSRAENLAKTTHIIPMNDNQDIYIEAIKQRPQTVVIGPAGTGKSFIAATLAANMFLDKDIDKIVITRPNIAASKSLGFFPGTLEEKLAPWAIPITDTLKKALGVNKFECDMKNGGIEVAPFETMRGRSFDNAFIILDEAQNATIHELKMFITRIGENCKVVINGDIKQTDLGTASGLARIVHMVKAYNIDASVVEFTIDDVVRSGITKAWLEAFDNEGL